MNSQSTSLIRHSSTPDLSSTMRYTTTTMHPRSDQLMQETLVSMNKTLCSMCTETSLLRSCQEENISQTQGLQFEQEQDHDELCRLGTELRRCMDKVDLLSNIVSKQDEEIEVMKTKIEKNIAAANKNSIFIVGLEAVEDENVTDRTVSFFKNVMKIEEELQLHSIYQVNPFTIRVNLRNLQQKSAIYSKVANLKGKKNSKNRPYQINDVLPEILGEEQRRYRQIVAANKKVLVDVQLKLSFKKGNLMIGNTPYHAKVTKQTACDLLNTTETELQDIQELLVAQSSDHHEKGSIFTRYAINVASIQTARKIYKHMKLKHCEATHVTMAYRLNGFNKAYDEGYIDDGETGSRRRLLNKLIEEEASDIMLIIYKTIWRYAPWQEKV